MLIVLAIRLFIIGPNLGPTTALPLFLYCNAYCISTVAIRAAKGLALIAHSDSKAFSSVLVFGSVLVLERTARDRR